MSYLLLIVEPLGQRAERTPAEGEAAYASMLRYTEELRERGVLIASQSLLTARRRLQVRDGRTTVLDGPYAEAKEMIGGFFYLNCDSLDDALALSAKCPAAQWATIEVREVGPCCAD
ncbi:YciI family protein [Solimonas variicoloris]|uniref:YciI family protein n=1 Tax=Solimonas variicoloris TaxID=254408 RepID=UPI00035FFE0C|nr:YciI family protein [Solimonas variicoloris]